MTADATHSIDTEIDFSAAAAAGLTHTELGRLCGVRRLTVLRWITHGDKPHKWIRPHVLAVLDSVKAAVDRGTLPLPYRTKSADENFRRVQKAIEAAKQQADQ